MSCTAIEISPVEMVRLLRRFCISNSKVKVLLRSLGPAGFLFTARAVSVIYQLRFANSVFGVSYGGLSALLNQVTFYILLAELGLSAATTSLLFEPVHRGETRRVKALMDALGKDVRRVVQYLAPLSLFLCGGLAMWLHRQVPVRVLLPSLLLTCISALLTFMALPFQSHFNASDRVPLRNVILGCGFALKVALGILLAKLLHSFVGIPLGTAVIGLGELMVQRAMVIPRLGREQSTLEMLESARSAIRERAKFVVAHRVGYLFIYQSDYIILLLASSLALLGYYAQYQYIYAGLLSFSLAVGGTLTARIAKRQIDEGVQGYPSLYRKTALLASCAAVICGSGFYLFADFAIKLLYRSTHYDHKAVALFSILLMLNVVKVNDDLWVDTTGAFQKGYYLPIMEACCYVALGLMLVRQFHIVGILYAGIATNLLFSVVLKSFVLGGGVMERKVLYTLGVKLSNLAAITLAFYFITAVLGMLPILPHF